MYSFIQSPSEKSQCLVVLFFPGCPDGICVNNISLVRQKISTGQHSGGDSIAPSPTSPPKKDGKTSVTFKYSFLPLHLSFQLPVNLSRMEGRSQKCEINAAFATIILRYHALQVQLNTRSWIKEVQRCSHYKKVSAAQCSFILVLFCIYNATNCIN